MSNCTSKDVDDCNMVEGCWCCEFNKDLNSTYKTNKMEGDKKCQ